MTKQNRTTTQKSPNHYDAGAASFEEAIDSLLKEVSSSPNSKYRIYRQFQKQEGQKRNIDFLKREYLRTGAYLYPDEISGWAHVENHLRELIKNDRYLNSEEKDHYSDFLEDEIHAQKKSGRMLFMEANRNLPPADKRDTLALRLSSFIRDLDDHEKSLLENVGRGDLADVTEGQMEQLLSEPATVQQLVDFLKSVQDKESGHYNEENAYSFTQELMELNPLRYLYHEGEAVHIGANKYKITAFDENTVFLRNAKFPLFRKKFSRADFEEKLKESPANDHLKTAIAESQKTETPAEEKPDRIPETSTRPSSPDHETTGMIHAAGKILGIPLEDHIIIAEKEQHSFKEHGETPGQDVALCQPEQPKFELKKTAGAYRKTQGKESAALDLPGIEK